MVTGLFLICGMGHVGRQIALLLRRLGAEVAVVTQQPRDDWLRGARDAGITVHLGDARDRQLLTAAGIERARALLATTSQDAVNIEIGLDARRLRPDLPVVLRLFDQTLARQLERSASFGVRRALGVSALAAPTLAAALLGADVQASFVLDGLPLVLGRTPQAPAAGQGAVLGPALPALILTGREAWLRLNQEAPAQPGWLLRLWRRLQRVRVVVEIWRDAPPALRSVLTLLWVLIFASVLVFRVGMRLSLLDAFYFIIATVTTTGYGDITPKEAEPWLKLYSCLLMLLGSAATALLYSLVTDFVVNERFRRSLGQHRVPEEGHAIVVGLGNVGFRVVEELRRQGVPVVAISRTEDGEFYAATRQLGPTLVGDGRMPETLLRAGLSGAIGLVAATDDDAANLAIALEGLRLRGGDGGRALPVVVRLLDAEFADKVRGGLDLPASFSTAALAAPTFVAAALDEGARAALVADGALLSLCERQAGLSWAGRTARQIEEDSGERPLVRRLGERAVEYLAEGGEIQLGDRLLVLVRRDLLA